MDKEKLIKDIESQMNEPTNEYVVLWFSEAEYVLSLLKEQEAVEPKKENDGNPEPWTAWWYVCGDCGQPIDRMDRYCRRCGKQVKWDA